MALINFTSGNQLPAADLNTNFGIVGPVVTTITPQASLPAITERPIFAPNNTTAYFWAFTILHQIVVNKVSFPAKYNTTGSTIDLAIYKEDGQTKVMGDLITSNITADGVKELAVSAVTLNPGRYYIALVVNTSGANLVGWFAMDYSPTVWDRLSGYSLTSEPKLAGTKAVTAGTLPATFNPVTDLTDMGINGGHWLPFRLDN